MSPIPTKTELKAKIPVIKRTPEEEQATSELLGDHTVPNVIVAENPTDTLIFSDEKQYICYARRPIEDYPQDLIDLFKRAFGVDLNIQVVILDEHSADSVPRIEVI